MRASFPLSLKISLWFVLNLGILLAMAAAIAFAQVGLGWDVLLQGPPGRRLQEMGQAAMEALSHAPPSQRNQVMDRVSASYGMRLVLWRNDGRRLAGPATELPAPVRAMLRPARHPEPGPPGDGASSLPPPDDPRGPAARPNRAAEGIGGRFLIRAGTPTKYWIGIREPWPDGDEGFPVPATLIASTSSVVPLAALFDWSPWLWTAAAAIVISALVWWPFVHGLTRQLARVSAAADRIAAGRLDTRITVRRRDEIGTLGASVNRMAQRLDELVTGQRRFLADAAHELCSPLARLQMAVGILEERMPRELESAVLDVREEAQAMSELTDSLLAFTRGGLVAPPVSLQSVDLNALIALAVAQESVTPTPRVLAQPGLRVQADSGLLRRAVGNLLRNAAQYGVGAMIEIQAEAQAEWAVIQVLDRGPGVPGDVISRLGEPFFRPEPARTREAGGVGLGLAIVRQAAAACGGSVHLPTGGEAVSSRNCDSSGPSQARRETKEPLDRLRKPPAARFHPGRHSW